MEEKKECTTAEEAYAMWKSSLEKHGNTPEEMVAYYQNLGMTEYADALESFISKMEALH